MSEIYLVTGATGFLGRTIMKTLLERGKEAVGLRLPDDTNRLITQVRYQTGDITKPETLIPFFEQAYGRRAVLIHCAGLVTIASEDEQAVYKVNVAGTRNIVDCAMEYNIDTLIYVSSVHAIREEPIGTVIKETTRFSADEIVGVYGKSKAEATRYVLECAKRGLNAMVVHPSGIIGPEDYSGSYMTETIRAFLKGSFPFAVEGGYDFVDVRDVAEGIMLCAEHGKQGETYILSNEYISVKRLFELLSEIRGKKKTYRAFPLKLLVPFASLIEKVEQKRNLPLLITPYSLYTLGSNGSFSHQKASMELDYALRHVEDTLRDVVRWLDERQG